MRSSSLCTAWLSARSCDFANSLMRAFAAAEWDSGKVELFYIVSLVRRGCCRLHPARGCAARVRRARRGRAPGGARLGPGGAAGRAVGVGGRAQGGGRGLPRCAGGRAWPVRGCCCAGRAAWQVGTICMHMHIKVLEVNMMINDITHKSALPACTSEKPTHWLSRGAFIRRYLRILPP